METSFPMINFNIIYPTFALILHMIKQKLKTSIPVMITHIFKLHASLAVMFIEEDGHLNTSVSLKYVYSFIVLLSPSLGHCVDRQ